MKTEFSFQDCRLIMQVDSRTTCVELPESVITILSKMGDKDFESFYDKKILPQLKEWVNENKTMEVAKEDVETIQHKFGYCS